MNRRSLTLFLLFHLLAVLALAAVAHWVGQQVRTESDWSLVSMHPVAPALTVDFEPPPLHEAPAAWSRTAAVADTGPTWTMEVSAPWTEDRAVTR